jgi:3-deoxy-D-manno-octulosonic-acid transferase
VAERLGIYTQVAPENAIWVHAVSVGEARAAEPLVRALQRALPGHRVIATCTTAAGRATLQRLFGDAVPVSWVPWDLPGPVQGFLAHFRPRLAILMETEVWPNLLGACAADGVPVLLANARMSEKSARRYGRWPSLAAPAFGALAAVCAQSEADAARLRGLGARAVEVTGNLKFDAEPDAVQLEAGRAWRRRLGRPVLLLASTREGEEELLLKEIERTENPPLTVVVPRHPQRFDEVAKLAQARRSLGELPDAATRVYLGDTMGEMAYYYGACDVALIGGSIAPLGGQNLIEALACGAPVVVGPSMFNFEEATRLARRAGAAVQAEDAAGAVAQCLALLGDAARRESMALAGKKLCELHRGATGRHLAACQRLISAPAPG